MSLFSAEGANESERERNRGARLILKAIAEDLGDATLGPQLATQVVALEFDKTLSGYLVTLHVTNPIAEKFFLPRKPTIQASLTRLYAPVSLTVEGFEIVCADEALIARIKRNEAICSTFHVPGHIPKTLTELVHAAIT